MYIHVCVTVVLLTVTEKAWDAETLVRWALEEDARNTLVPIYVDFMQRIKAQSHIDYSELPRLIPALPSIDRQNDNKTRI
jgi:hypothetical protein